MFTQIASFLLSILFTTLIGAALLRCYFNFASVPMRNPIGQFLMALTDWLVRPLRRVFRPKTRFDVASFLTALLFSLTYTLLLTAVMGMWPPSPEWVILHSLVEMLRIAIQTLMLLLIMYAVLSWINPEAPIYHLLARVFAPLLVPLHRMIPLVGGVDLAPLALIVLLQIALMLLSRAA
jgi:YggT family protein